MNKLTSIRLAAITLSLCLTALVLADDAVKQQPATVAATSPADKAAAAKLREAQQHSLQFFGSLIGEWRGVGLPKRGSNRGAWTEKSEWIWDFSKPDVSIFGRIEKGKLAKSIRIRPAAKEKEFLVDLESPTGEFTTFKAKFAEKKVVGESPAADDGYVQRLTITQLNDKRSLLLLEKRREKQTFYSRIAEIGYTRAGTSLAVAGNSGPACVVTGGKGTIAVSHKGKKYYVCCSGCKQAFDDDPEGILADYRERLKAEKQKKK